VVLDEVEGRLTVAIDGGEPFEVDATTGGVPGLFSLITSGRPSRAYVARRGQGYEVTVGGRTFELLPAGAAGRRRGVVGGAEDPVGVVSAPLAGVVVAVHVEVGARIEAGQLLLVVEAMKMQNEVHAPHAGTVTEVLCEAGGRVERGDVVIRYEVE
jgi:biotin carboxyl carrier protein